MASLLAVLGAVACAPKAAVNVGSGNEASLAPSKPDATTPPAVALPPAPPDASPAASCVSGVTEPCSLIAAGCATGQRTCTAGSWGACVFNNPVAAPRCTTECAGGLLNGDRLFTPVNRFDALRPDWSPSDLLGVPGGYRTIDPLERMRLQPLGHMMQMLAAQHQAAGPKIYCGSPYRSFGAQCQLFGQYVAQDKCTKANTYSAMAGHSEHQLGTACDLVYPDNNLIQGNTPGDAWLAEHAYEYGYVQSYPEGTTDLTGYETEPWHFRYLGKRAALLHHRMQLAAARAISTHEFIATIACWPAMKVDELAAEEADDAASARDTVCAQWKASPLCHP